MKIAIIGRAGLYCAYPLKRVRPDADIHLVEQNLATLWSAAPQDFVYSYITRSRRISDERLSRIAPSFMADYPRNRPASGPAGRTAAYEFPGRD